MLAPCQCEYIHNVCFTYVKEICLIFQVTPVLFANCISQHYGMQIRNKHRLKKDWVKVSSCQRAQDLCCFIQQNKLFLKLWTYISLGIYIIRSRNLSQTKFWHWFLAVSTTQFKLMFKAIQHMRLALIYIRFTSTNCQKHTNKRFNMSHRKTGLSF